MISNTLNMWLVVTSLVCLCQRTTHVQAWQPPPTKIQNPFHELVSEVKMIPALILASAIALSPLPAKSADRMINSDTRVSNSLKAPTEERPQIKFSPELLRGNNGLTIPPSDLIQSLVSLADPQLRPGPSDTLVLQIWDHNPNTKGAFMGGAKIPVAKLRFPVLLQVGPENAVLNTMDSWKKKTSEMDIFVRATICPESAVIKDPNVPCGQGVEPLFQGLGASKLLFELPGIDSEVFAEAMEAKGAANGGIRVPAAVTLKFQANES